MSGCKPCGTKTGQTFSSISTKPTGQTLQPYVQSYPTTTPVSSNCAPVACVTPTNIGTSICQPAVPCAPKPSCPPAPYYQQVSICPEDNTKCVVNLNFSAVLKSASAFNMPQCGAVAQVVFQGLKDIALYSQLWAYGVGYLTVTAFDPATGTVTLRNDCNDSCGTQLSPGSLIASCTPFVSTAPPCSSGLTGACDSSPFLAAQFTAPADGTCIDISVTTTIGLVAGKQVQIGGGTYLLDTIYSGTLIKVCNEGQGVTPGSIVNAYDSAGNCITPIILVDQNPCTNPAELSGKMVVCKNNLMVPLVGTGNNQVPVYDHTTGEVALRDLLIPVGECTSLTVCLTLDPALPVGTAYLVQVVDSSIFIVGQLVTMQGIVFTVDSIPSATTIRLVPLVHPAVVQTFGVGTPLCGADCCTEINNTLDNICDFLEDKCCPQVGPGPIPLQFFTTAVVFAGNTFETVVSTNVVEVTLPDTACTYFLKAHVTVGVLSDFVTPPTNPVTNLPPVTFVSEVEAVWDTALGPPRVTGKAVWRDTTPADGFDVTAAYPASGDFAIWSQLQLGGPNFPISYNVQEVTAITEQPGNTTCQLEIHYKVVRGDNSFPVDFTSRMYVAGHIELYRR